MLAARHINFSVTGTVACSHVVFQVIPRTKVYPMRDVSGFTMRISQKRHRVVYQVRA